MELSYGLLIVLAIMLSWAIAAELFREMIAKAFKGFMPPALQPASPENVLDYAPPEHKTAWMRRHLWIPAAVVMLMVATLWAPAVVITMTVRDRLPDLPLPKMWLWVLTAFALSVAGAGVIVRRGLGRAADTVPAAANWRGSRHWLAIAGCVAGILATVVVHDALMNRRLDALREQGRAQVVAMSSMGQDTSAAQLYRDAEAVWASRPQATEWLNARRPAPEPPPFPAELLEVVEKVHAAAEAEAVDFGVDWRTWSYAGTLPHLPRLRTAARILNWHAIDSARAGDWEAAVVDIRVIHRISRQGDHGITLVEWLNSLGIEALAMSTAEACLSFARSEADLERLPLTEASLYGESARRAMIGEQEMMRVTLADFLQGYPPLGTGRATSMGMRLLIGPAEVEDLESVYKALHLGAARLTDDVPPRPLVPAAATRGVMVSMTASSSESSLKAAVDLKATQQNLELAIAATRYRLRNGELPSDMEALVSSGLLARIPLDPWDGKPWKFVHKGDHVVIYSVGRDMTDDGGNDGRNMRRRDNIMRVSGRPVWVFQEQPEVEPGVGGEGDE